MNAEAEPEVPIPDLMCSGHIAILDVLGWKGIWKRHEVGKVLRAVNVVRQAVQQIDEQTVTQFAPPTPEVIAQVAEKHRALAAQHGEEVHAEYDRVMQDLHRRLPDRSMVSTETVFLSDTLVIGSWTPTVWGAQMAGHLESARRLHLCGVIARTLRECAAASVPLIFRGTIAPGEFLIDKNLILGQAVDDAAELMDEANAAIVWFTPPGFSEPPDQQFGHYLDYDIPLHGGRTLWAQAVNPFFGCYDRDQIEPAFAGMLRAFGNSNKVDIVIKRQNTEMFLHVARERWVGFLDSPRGQALLARMAEATPPPP